MKEAEVIIVFHGINEAITGERLLLDNSIDVRVMPMPRSLGPACEMVLRIDSGEIEKVRAMLGDSIDNIYCREGEGFVPWPC